MKTVRKVGLRLANGIPHEVVESQMGRGPGVAVVVVVGSYIFLGISEKEGPVGD